MEGMKLKGSYAVDRQTSIIAVLTTVALALLLLLAAPPALTEAATTDDQKKTAQKKTTQKKTVKKKAVKKKTAKKKTGKTKTMKQRGVKQECRDADLVPTSSKYAPRIERSLRCLVNAERKKRKLKSLKLSPELKLSSEWQGLDMLTHGYFDHLRDGGPEFAKRILDFGYGGRYGYQIGENLAWSSARIATPKRIVRMWLKSRTHRRNMLTRAYRDQAISAIWSDGGVSGDYAGADGPLLVFVNQFGRSY